MLDKLRIFASIYDNFSEYINYREIEIESVSRLSKTPSIAPFSLISKRSSFADSTSEKITKHIRWFAELAELLNLTQIKGFSLKLI